LGYMWAKMAKAAEDGLASGDAAREYYLKNKLVTARFFMERLMPETALRKARIEAGADQEAGRLVVIHHAGGVGVDA
ncbi:acyl-CoA dehydrogenase C-terminal domain-containing protein, partial [Rhizobium leguminosarum]|uniref:acyl-CoA dehydrogenase C-terminal domain-containing protein n=1 Tax=Rhizobium leguminosarum TaxID=384 RepID=UPI003F958FB4